MKEKKCLNCGEVVFGRSDKKFCDSECRNEYNYKHNKDQTNYMRRINYILRKNRKILETKNPKGKSKTNKRALEKEGFDFNYITSIYRTRNGKTYYFCYEQGYLPLENDWYALVIKQDYAE